LDASDIGTDQNNSLSFDAPNYKYVDFDVTGIEVTLVPIPAAAWLFGSGLIGLFGWTRRRQA
jgi:hypothetical protein